MLTPSQYFKETKDAVQGLFSCISKYHGFLEQSATPAKGFSCETDEEFNKQYRAWRSLPEKIEAQKNADQAFQDYLLHKPSYSVVSGSILQIACKAIELFSINDEIQNEHLFLFDGCSAKTKIRISRYAIGRTIRTVPIGLVIYAGRNQYNHLEQTENLSTVNSNVFRALADNTGHEDYSDPGFILSNKKAYDFASSIFGLLEWRDFEDYEIEMAELTK